MENDKPASEGGERESAKPNAEATGAIGGKPTKRDGVSVSRRTALLGCAGAAAMLALGLVKLTPDTSLVRPPGGSDKELLYGACNRCGRCIEACPRHVIVPSHIEEGIVSTRTPKMDFYSNHCDFCAEENDGVPLCNVACPTGALRVDLATEPEQQPIGKAELIEDWCLAYNDTGCRFCYDACPYKAIELDEHDRPYVIPDKCNGCGACEAACVSLTEGSRSLNSGATSRAIVVRPLDLAGEA